MLRELHRSCSAGCSAWIRCLGLSLPVNKEGYLAAVAQELENNAFMLSATAEGYCERKKIKVECIKLLKETDAAYDLDEEIQDVVDFMRAASCRFR